MAASRENTPSLLDDVLSKLSTLPGRRRLTATVLISQPRKKSTATVFPYAPKIEDVEGIEQEVLLLIAENKDTQQTEDRSQSDGPLPSPAAYVVAIGANLYIFPTTHSVIVYISKVDTTGQGQRPSPTRAATVALLEHIVRRWLQAVPPRGLLGGTYGSTYLPGRKISISSPRQSSTLVKRCSTTPVSSSGGKR